MESTTIQKEIKSALPICFAAAAFLLACLVLPVYKLFSVLVAFVLAVAAYVAGKKMVPPRVVTIELPRAAFNTGERALDETLTKAREDLDKLAALNAQIQDETLSAAMDRMQSSGQAILDEIVRSPKKAKKIRRFATYYLPTSLRVLTQYATLASSGAKGENAQQLKKEVQENVEVVACAFERQLDALFAGENLDVSAELAVLESMAASDGVASDFSASPSLDTNAKLQL